MTKKTKGGFTTLELVVILIVVVMLATFIGSKYEIVRQTRRDDQRKNDIAALELGIESYWAQTGNFPSLAQLNNHEFRDTSLNKLDPGAAQDPSWNSRNKYCASQRTVTFENIASPHKGCYGYVPSPSGCDNKATACSGYSLNARLESGGFYSKSSS